MHDLLEPRADLLVQEPAALVEASCARRGPAARLRARGRRRSRAPCGALPAPRRRRTCPVLAPTTATGLFRSAAAALRPGRPVDRVLQDARDRRVVLGRREEEGVGAGDRVAELRDGRRRLARSRRPRRTAARPSARPTARARRRRAASSRRRAEQVGVVGAGAEAAGDGEDLHRSYAAFTNCRSVTMRTSIAERRLAARERRVPADAEVGAVDRRGEPQPDPLVAVGIGQRSRGRPGHLDGRATPLIVSSPLAVTSPALRSTSSAVKRSSGWRSASKKSGDCRWALRFSSLTSTLETCATPSRRARSPSAVELSRDLVELALERAGHVVDLEPDRRVDGIELPGAGELARCGDAHVLLFLSCTI